MNVRTLSKAGCVLGVLTCLVAVLAPSAYGSGELDGTTESIPVEVTDVPDVTQVADAAPVVEQVTTEVSETTAPVTEPVEEVATAPAEVVQASTEPLTPSTSDAADAPADPIGAVTSPGEDGSTSTSTTTSDGTSTGDASQTTAGADPASSDVTAASPQQGLRMPSFSGSVSSFRAPQLAAAGKPGDVLDDLLEIGNSIGVDEVRGLQITSARGDAEAAAAQGSESSSSAPAPLALTGIAVGAFLAIGSLLVLAGNGARSAGRVSAV
jgi:cobalamin biosynthesis Mg chelatase CobN